MICPVANTMVKALMPVAHWDAGRLCRTKAVLDEDGDGIFEPGDTVLYSIVVTNSGDAPAANVVVRDPVSLASLDNITVLDGGTFAGSTVTWRAATTPALASVAAPGLRLLVR